MIEERKKLERDIREGKIFNGIQQMGRGRGAAMTLPAWMTEVFVVTDYDSRLLHPKETHLQPSSMREQNREILMYIIGSVCWY